LDTKWKSLWKTVEKLPFGGVFGPFYTCTSVLQNEQRELDGVLAGQRQPSNIAVKIEPYGVLVRT